MECACQECHVLILFLHLLYRHMCDMHVISMPRLWGKELLLECWTWSICVTAILSSNWSCPTEDNRKSKIGNSTQERLWLAYSHDEVLLPAPSFGNSISNGLNTCWPHAAFRNLRPEVCTSQFYSHIKCIYRQSIVEISLNRDPLCREVQILHANRTDIYTQDQHIRDKHSA